jgi:Terpene cyclase DEP1
VNTLSPKHILYVVLALFGLATTWMHGFAWMAAGGNILNLYSFFRDAYVSGDAAAFLTIDILIAWGVFMIWVVGDATKIGLGSGKGWLFLALSGLGTCFAFPLYLVVRERFLAAKGAAG